MTPDNKPEIADAPAEPIETPPEAETPPEESAEQAAARRAIRQAAQEARLAERRREIAREAEQLGMVTLMRSDVRTREAVRFTQRPPEGMEAPVLRHLVREALRAMADEMAEEFIGSYNVDVLNSQSGKAGVLVTLHYVAPVKRFAAPPEPVQAAEPARPGANVHGIGPDEGGGPNPDYKPEPATDEEIPSDAD